MVGEGLQARLIPNAGIAPELATRWWNIVEFWDVAGFRTDRGGEIGRQTVPIICWCHSRTSGPQGWCWSALDDIVENERKGICRTLGDSHRLDLPLFLVEPHELFIQLRPILGTLVFRLQLLDLGLDLLHPIIDLVLFTVRGVSAP